MKSLSWRENSASQRFLTTVSPFLSRSRVCCSNPKSLYELPLVRSWIERLIKAVKEKRTKEEGLNVDTRWTEKSSSQECCRFLFDNKSDFSWQPIHVLRTT
jgi:hypothetical protein